MLTGGATDPTGAAIAGVSIRLKNIGTNETRSGATNSFGDYIFGDLVPGFYELNMQKDGYRRVVQQAIVIRV